MKMISEGVETLFWIIWLTKTVIRGCMLIIGSAAEGVVKGTEKKNYLGS